MQRHMRMYSSTQNYVLKSLRSKGCLVQCLFDDPSDSILRFCWIDMGTISLSLSPIGFYSTCISIPISANRIEFNNPLTLG